MYALFLFTALVGTHSSVVSGWSYQTDFSTEQRCIDAARKLNVTHEKFRCILK